MTEPLSTYDHPYYATEGNYHATGYHHEFESWEDFLDEMGSLDLDYNLLYRWDWDTPDPDDSDQSDLLSLFYIMQRKACPMSASVQVTKDQEPEIRAWLTVRAEHLRSVWEPLL